MTVLILIAAVTLLMEDILDWRMKLTSYVSRIEDNLPAVLAVVAKSA